MISSPPTDEPTTRSDGLIEEAWSPAPILLEAASGDDELIADLIDAFTTDTDARIVLIRAALAASDFSRIRAEAHTIKGGARQVGADNVADACQELETVSRLQDASAVAAQLNRVGELFDIVCRGMAAYSARRCPNQTVQPLI